VTAAVLLASQAWPQNQEVEVIPSVFQGPKYVAPANAPAEAVMAGRDERGDRLIVTGLALDDGQPVADVSVYVFHADAAGLFNTDGRNSEDNARLFAALRTDAEGRYRYETIRPSGSDGQAARVRHIVNAPGYRPRFCDLWFSDEPALASLRDAGASGSESQPMFVRTPTRDGDGIWRVTHDLELLRY
jgi:protocatechuate 3,4-dioxygenase beta subunit